MAETRTITCPDCGQSVDVPLTGEKARCAGCGRKFRFDLATAGPSAGLCETPTVEDLAAARDEAIGAAEVACPVCGHAVSVPTTGEKVRCPGCGQKFRYDLRSEAASDEPAEPLAQAQERAAEAPADQPPTNDIECPRCGRMVPVPTSGEKVRCPGCGQKFRYDKALGAGKPTADAAGPDEELPSIRPPEPVAEAPPLAIQSAGGSPYDAEELHALWPVLCGFVAHLYEAGEATDDDRVQFRKRADRAGELARRVLPPPPDRPEAWQVITSVLPEATLEEILGLSVEDFRHLRESLDEAQGLLDRLVPQPEPREAEPAALAAAARRPRERRRVGTGALIALAALIGIVVGVLLALPIIRQRMRTPDGRQLSWAEILGIEWKPHVRAYPATSAPVAAPGTGQAAAPGTSSRGRTSTSVGAPTSAVPTFVPSTRVPGTATSVSPVPPRTPPERKQVVRRVPSRWKPDADGWLTLWNGRDLDGWVGDLEAWSVRDGALYGIELDSMAVLTAQEAEWTHYHLCVEAKLGERGALALHHGPLAAAITNDRCRLGYPDAGWRVLDERTKGPSRKKWYRFDFDAKGRRAEVRVNGILLLETTGHEPQPGPPAIEIRQGGVAVRSVRLQLHESDPAYRGVMLGEGVEVVGPPPEAPAAPQATLGPGSHVLFNGRDLEGWAKAGDWAVRTGTLLARAPFGELATVAKGSDQWRDYTVRARCRLTRRSRIVREGEYYLVIVRYRDPDTFFCIRFATEGIYELGYYHRGRWREVSRARHGLNTDFNVWRDIQITVKGDQLWLEIDGIGGKPPWTIPRGFGRGGVGLGVTGGEAAFDNVRVRLPN